MTRLNRSHAAHPRSRGENFARTRRAQAFFGSSPLTRGKRDVGGVSAGGGGLIPAHAGKTARAASIADTSRAHPRSRGENTVYSTPPVAIHGSSPLTRGKRHHGVDRGLDERLIPAHAGKTACTFLPMCECGAHPRSRGENHRMKSVAASLMGSSPLTRGKHGGHRKRRQRCRLIPAHAGKTSRRLSLTRRLSAHPRSRGENSALKKHDRLCGGSSPLTRGKL